VIRIDELLHFILDLPSLERDILFREELFFPVIVNLFVFDAANELGLSTFTLDDVSVLAILSGPMFSPLS
jgi:hypothetical protein